VWINQGSHCPYLSIASAKKLYDLVFPTYSNITNSGCIIGVSTVLPYERICPDKFGPGEKYARNPWRDAAKNLLQQEAYEKLGISFVSLDTMSLSVQDVTMVGSDCVHFKRVRPFNFYMEATKMQIAAAGQSC
jgi:hypothetical protein